MGGKFAPGPKFIAMMVYRGNGWKAPHIYLSTQRNWVVSFALQLTLLPKKKTMGSRTGLDMMSNKKWF